LGGAGSAILAVAESAQSDLTVLCSHGYTGMTRWALGSVAEKVVRSAPIPVLVLREGGPVPARPHPDVTRPLRALVALDGSMLAKAALEPAASLIAALATPAQGVLHLVRVVKPVSPDSEEKDPEEREHFLHKAKTYLSTTAEHLREGLVAPAVADLTLPVTWSVALDTDVAEGIVRVAENGEDVEVGANGLVLFNRFYQPDFDLDELKVIPDLDLSTSYELRLPLRWIAILYGRIAADFALTGGVHTAQDVLKAMMAGANVSMMASELLAHGPGRLGQMIAGIERWMEEHEYESIAQMKGCMSPEGSGRAGSL
jgi:nucleotide-binding universal stress UspA family protein